MRLSRRHLLVLGGGLAALGPLAGAGKAAGPEEIAMRGTPRCAATGCW